MSNPIVLLSNLSRPLIPQGAEIRTRERRGVAGHFSDRGQSSFGGGMHGGGGAPGGFGGGMHAEAPPVKRMVISAVVTVVLVAVTAEAAVVVATGRPICAERFLCKKMERRRTRSWV